MSAEGSPAALIKSRAKLSTRGRYGNFIKSYEYSFSDSENRLNF